MWYISIIFLFLTIHVMLRIIIKHLEKIFDKDNVSFIEETNKMSKHYKQQYNDDILGFSNAIFLWNKKSLFVKDMLKEYKIYWLAKILTYSYV